MNDKELKPSKSGFTPEIPVSWVYNGDITIRDHGKRDAGKTFGAMT